MPNIVDKCEIVLYADDTLIFSEGDSDNQCYDKLNQDMKNVNEWLKMNKLKLNESKTKIMEINTNSNIIFKVNNEKIEKVNQIKYLGFVIDKNLNFKNHISVKKSAKKLVSLNG